MMGKHRKPYDDQTDILAEIVEETPDLDVHSLPPEPPPTGEYVGPRPDSFMTIWSGVALLAIVVAIVLAIIIISTNGAPLCR